MNCLKRLELPLLSIVLTLFLTMVEVVPSYAVDLKDIRVGEYDDHTRVVFELSAATTQERIVPMESGRLTIVFAATRPQLARKIPIENSRRVENIKLWHREGNLSVVLSFAFDHFRYELTKYKSPVRIALDIYQLPTAPKGQISKTATPGPINATDQLPILPDATPPVAPHVPAEATINAPSVDQSAELQHEDQAADLSGSAPAPIPAAPEAIAISPTSSSPIPAEADSAVASPSAKPSSMQFFLVVGLVTLTTVILVLLLIMLLSKQRWVNNAPPLEANVSLKKQDDRIAALNAQVQEQIKRYDEA